MKKRTIALCIVTLALFMLFSMASSGSSEQNYYSDNNTSSENNNTYSDDDSDFDLDSFLDIDSYLDVDSTTKATSAETKSRLVTPCEFTLDNVDYYVETASLDRIPNDDLGLYSLPSGQMYLVIAVQFRNNTNSDIYVSSSDFSVYTDNRLCDEKWILVDGIDSSASVSSGREAVIYGFFAVPTDYSSIEIEYQKDWLSDKITIIAGKIEPLQ